mmetsp:Transcript_150224/g.273505  ORF Transcript_150224/g.273505 Transcript_150224/m.273505 type:complete len:519 (-) Transcript_150224:39-1595(-)
MLTKGKDEERAAASDFDIQLEAAVDLPDIKFSAAHFVAFRGFREPVHGHNYTASVRIGGRHVQADGYLVDFGDLKKALREVCKSLNNSVLIPAHSDVLQTRKIEAAQGTPAQLDIVCEDGSNIRLPFKDCKVLPIVHSTAEEIAEYIWIQLFVTCGLATLLLSRSVEWLEVSVYERVGQGARYRRSISEEILKTLTAADQEGSSPDAFAGATLRRAAARPPRPCLTSAEEVDTADRDGSSHAAPAPAPAPGMRSRFRMPRARARARFCTGTCWCCGVSASSADPSAGGQAVTPASAAATSPPVPTAAMPQAMMSVSKSDASMAKDPRAVAEAAFRSLIETLGDREAGRPELVKTPARAAKAWLELTSGIAEEDPLSAVGEGIFEVEGAQDLVAVRDIQFNSLCEHHLLPFWGTAHVAYIPDGRVLGLSKFARLLKVFSRRLQLQERLTHQFVEALEQLLAPQAVMVSMEARHACMSLRGVATPAVTRTVAFRGPCKDIPATREMLLLGAGSEGSRARL